MEKKNKTQADDDFEKLMREFTETDFDDDDSPEDSSDTDDLDDQPVDDVLPFPREVDERVADAMMNMNREESRFMDDVASVTLDFGPGLEKGFWWNAPVEVTFRPKAKASFRMNRFKCSIFDENFFPICQTHEDSKVKRSKGRALTMEMESNHIWIPGKYILLINEELGCSVIHIDFTLDDNLEATLSEPRLHPAGSLEDVLTNCMQGKDEDWEIVAEMPGMAQFRKKAMESRRLLLYNEVRKEQSLDEVRACKNLLVCTRNDDIDAETMKSFQRLVVLGAYCSYIDCSSLYNPGCSNPFEPLNDLLEESPSKILCFTNLKELMGSNGKVILRKIIEKVRSTRGKQPLWLCGTRQEIDDLLGLFPSLRQFFFADSFVAQEPYTAFELVEAFFDELACEHMQPNILVKDLLAHAVMQGYQQGVLTGWSLDDVHRFVVEQIRPRYLRRAMEVMEDSSGALLNIEDVPFDKLTSGSSAFDDSIRELNEMIGLDNVKQGIMTMAHQALLLTERRRRGLKTGNSMIFHSVFTGNPGTGKTTVARKLGKIYRSLGLLSKGEVIAVDRTRLVGQYIGQTEENMKIVLEEAKGNVLFIDEAYTLNVGSEDRKDFGGRVLDSLLTILTQPNPDMLIIFAGYPKEMEAMLNTNPGLSGRFPYRYQFKDYSAEQLMEIACKLFERDEYTLTEEARKELQNVIAQALAMKMPNFGNARWVEQLVNNGIIPAMADRLFSRGSNPSAGDIDLQRIEASDITKAFEKFKPKSIESKPAHKRVTGFGA